MIQKSRWIYDGLAGNEDEVLRAETGLGSALAAEVRAATQSVQDSAITTLVDGVCHRLHGSVQDRRRTFRCEVIGGNSPNAMALPGGFVFVSLPLVEFCQRRPDELAFLIAHEMSHVIRRDTWDRMLNETMSRAASVVTSRAGLLGSWLRESGLGLLQSAHARSRELEADELSFRLASAARFDPGGCLALLRRVERLGTDPMLLGQYFASHPPASERIACLQLMVRRFEEPGSDPGPV